MIMNTFYRFAITLLLTISCALTASSDSLTSQEALSRVVVHLNSRATSAHRAPIKSSSFELAKVGALTQQSSPAYYIFNRTSGGFIVAPADDTQPAILALIDEGAYDETKLPDGFKAWISEVTTCGAAKVPAQRTASAVSPLLAEDQIAWTQTAPYYNDCPKFLYQGYNYETLAGCAAIAVGQIMRYHKFPEQGYGSVNYESYVNVGGEEIVTNVDRNLDEHTYDWSKIRGNYQYSDTGTNEERAEVAKFVADVACACKMNFDPTASATTDLNVALALKNNFDYDPSLRLVDHSYYSTEEWADLLRAELDEGRPVYLSGANVTSSASGDMLSGHAFVCDGYNADGLFHINWGWGGTSDGYFALTSLNPRSQGAGGSGGGYSFMSNAIIGIQPYCDGEESKALLSLSGEYWETSYDAENDGYVVRVNIANVSATDFEGFVALRLMEDDTELLAPKQLAWKLGCKAGSSGTLGKGVNKDFFLTHPTACIELVYAHCAGVNGASDEQLTQMLEGIADSEWLPIASREGSPKSLQTFVDAATQKISFGNVADEVYQLRFAGLDADKTPAAGRMVTFTAKVTNESDYEYFAPLYLFIYDSAGNQIAYSDYDLHLLPAHSTKKYNFTMTLPSGYSSFRYAMAYEDKGYDWSYVPMPLSNQDGYMTANLFEDNVPVTPDPEQPGTDPDEPDPDEPGYTPADGAKAYYVKNVDSGYYLNVIEHDRSCAVLAETPEVLYFEPTAKADEYIIKGHTGLYLGGHEDNVWNMSSACPETWIVETQADGSVAFHAKSNAGAVNGYIGFDTNYFQYYALGAAAKRNQRTTAHGLFLLEAVGEEPGTDPDPEQPGTDPEQPGTDPEQPATDLTIAAVGAPVAIPGGTFPTIGAGYYLKNVDSGCYLVAVPSDKKSALLSHTPEELFFTASGAGYTIKDADGNYIGKYDTPTASNVWNISSTVPEIWTLEEISTGKYALKAASSSYLGFDDMDTNVTPTKYFDTDADGFAAFRNKNYATNHGLFTIESARIYGDVDENRTLNTSDVDALVNILLRKKDVTPEADTDLSRFITIKDVTTLIKYLNKNNKK